jgi:signal transduction histidine kinase
VETPIRVLVADDTDDIRLLIRSTLQRDGRFDVVAEASDGVESIREAARHHPDVVILDLAMPQMDGLEAIPAIRRRSPESKIIVLSVFPAERMASQALSAGANAYIEKTDIHRLVPLLMSILGQPAGEEVPSAEPRSADPTAVAGPPSELLQALAHELLSPVTVIMRLAETVRTARDELDQETIDRCLDSIASNASHMAELIGSLADAHRVDAGMLALDPRPTDVSALVRQTLDDMGSVLDRHLVEASLPDGVTASIDRVRVRQVLTNLLTNAAKFSPEGSRVTIELAAADGDVHLVVADEGPGLPDPDVAFQKFSPLSSTRRGGGLGLGLYIARGIARAHGGDLVASSEGPGTRFDVRLPA